MRPSISQTAVTCTFVPFALLLSAALLAPERSDALDYGRLIYSIWVALAFAVPALCLFIFPRSRAEQYELLTWSFSFSAYLVHFYYAFGVTYGFSVARTYAGQGPVIATNNFLITTLWTFDVATSWVGLPSAQWIRVARVLARILVFSTFVASAVVIFGGFVRVLGVLLVSAIAVCISLRVIQVVRQRALRGRATELGSTPLLGGSSH